MINQTLTDYSQEIAHLDQYQNGDRECYLIALNSLWVLDDQDMEEDERISNFNDWMNECGKRKMVQALNMLPNSYKLKFSKYVFLDRQISQKVRPTLEEEAQNHNLLPF